MEQYSKLWIDDSFRKILLPSQNAFKNYFYVQEIGYFKTVKGYYTRRKDISSYLLLHTVSGHGKLHYNSRDYSLHPGDTFLIDCKKHQFYCQQGAQPWEFYWIHFDGQSTAGYYEDFLQSNGSPVISNFEFLSVFKNIVDLCEEKNINSEIKVSLNICKILTDLVVKSREKGYNVCLQDNFLITLKHYIDENFRKSITLNSLQKTFGVNKYSIHRQFKFLMGISINEYIAELRISKAKELLRYSSLSINQIAVDVGIENTSYFIKLFKAKESTTPHKYRALCTFNAKEN